MRIGLIQNRKYSYTSLEVIVKKPDGSIQFSIDYQKVNHKIQFDANPISQIEDHLDALTEAKAFSTMDLMKGYFQMRLGLASKEIIAFRTAGGLY